MLTAPLLLVALLAAGRTARADSMYNDLLGKLAESEERIEERLEELVERVASLERMEAGLKKPEPAALTQPLKACLGANDCCTPSAPCSAGDGDCDSAHDCRGSLVCGRDNCDPDHLPADVANATSFNQGDDCCVERPVPCDRPGGLDCCTRGQPCAAGEGGCDFDFQCKWDLVCRSNSCPFDPSMDCCQRP